MPRSLLAREGKTFAVVALMQRAGGLNRDRRREHAWDSRIQRSWPEGVDSDAPQAELSLLARFLDQSHRAVAFWNLVAARRERRRDPVAAYIVSLEAHLLRAFDPAWETIELDEDALQRACPPWAEIRARVLEGTSRLVRRPRLSPFMLWPALCADLDRWPALEHDRRGLVARAVFALSSVGWTDWFVHEALRRCPELEPELGLTCPGFRAAAPQPEITPVERVPLPEICRRLMAICDELRERPCLEAVEDLLACAQQAQAWSAALPERRLVALRALRLEVEGLLAAARMQSADPALAWLSQQVLAQVEARWHLASHDAEAAALDALALDALQARGRLTETGTRCVEAWRLLRTRREALALAEAEAVAGVSLARRRAAELARADAMRELLESESALPAVEDELLAALSPRGASFDLSVDYVAAWREVLVAASAPAARDAAAPRAIRGGDAAPSASVALDGEMAELLVSSP